MRRALFSLFLFFVFIHSAQAVRIEITEGQVAPTPIAVPDMIQGSPLGQEATSIINVIRNDLANCGLFRLVDPRSFLDQVRSLTQTPRFQDWRLLDARCLCVSELKETGAGQLSVSFKLYDTVTGQLMSQETLSMPTQKWRKLAHRVADAIYKRITGETGYFDSQIVYIHEEYNTLLKKRKRRLSIMDQDGANQRFLTAGNNIVLMPRVSPCGRYIAYLAFKENNKKAQITLYDLKKKREESLGKFEGLTFTPNFSPDGRWLVMSLAKDGTTCLYKMGLETRQLIQLTFPRKTSYGGSIDTSPCFSHDGSEIVFTSDREGEGKEHIYVMRADGTNVRRISFLEGKYSQPEWSKTRGDLIVFTKQYGGAFYICVFHPDGSGERLLTTGYLTESPTWSPNGRVILFKKEVLNSKQQAAIEGRVASYLYQIDLTGRNEKRLPTINQASGPAWSFCVDSEASS